MASTLNDVRMGSASGAFLPGPLANNNSSVIRATATENMASSGDGIELHANRSNAAYSGSKVQVAALQVLACIRA